jgi:hypothetical protein
MDRAEPLAPGSLRLVAAESFRCTKLRQATEVLGRHAGKLMHPQGVGVREIDVGMARRPGV